MLNCCLAHGESGWGASLGFSGLMFGMFCNRWAVGHERPMALVVPGSRHGELGGP